MNSTEKPELLRQEEVSAPEPTRCDRGDVVLSGDRHKLADFIPGLAAGNIYSVITSTANGVVFSDWATGSGRVTYEHSAAFWQEILIQLPANSPIQKANEQERYALLLAMLDEFGKFGGAL